jgi:hypothetical protein
VASYNPWVSLFWLVTGKTIGGTTMYPRENRVSRETALRLWTASNTWFSNDEHKKGTIKVGQLADLAVLSADYMNVAEDEIKNLVSVLTVFDGTVVHGDGPFSELAPPLPPASPDWSPVNRFGGHYKHRNNAGVAAAIVHTQAHQACSVHCDQPQFAWLTDMPAANQREFWGALGCNCWMG